MIRLASLNTASTVTKSGLRTSLPCLSRSRLTSTSSSLATRSFSSKKEEDVKPKGIPYNKLTVGVPKERFPLEKRVAATPEVRWCLFHCNGAWFLFIWTFISRSITLILISNNITHTNHIVRIQTSQARLQRSHWKGSWIFFVFFRCWLRICWCQDCWGWSGLGGIWYCDEGVICSTFICNWYMQWLAWSHLYLSHLNSYALQLKKN